ncbi:MAG: hypothetical protein JSW11_20625 [Candidatus Heimdallarchaeota archaeon]|nr:MAG: hypothetical protein JSW11_20625 [Candidatus Heimdallarchaeota archaeon]
MWEWRFFCDLASASYFFTNQTDLESAINSEDHEIRFDRYVNLRTPELGLKFRNIRNNVRKALLELKVLFQTNQWKAEFWEKPIRRYTFTHPGREVIPTILHEESNKLYPELSKKINWILDHISSKELEFTTIKKKRKILHLYDPNKVVKSKFQIPKASTRIEQTVVEFNQTTWKTISIQSYNDQTIKGILDNLAIDERYIISGYPGFLIGQSTTNNNL